MRALHGSSAVCVVAHVTTAASYRAGQPRAERDHALDRRDVRRDVGVRGQHDGVDRGEARAQRARDDARQEGVADPPAGRDQQRALRSHRGSFR